MRRMLERFALHNIDSSIDVIFPAYVAVWFLRKFDNSSILVGANRAGILASCQWCSHDCQERAVTLM